MIGKAQFYRNFVVYSVKEDAFSFLGGRDELADPQRVSPTMHFLLGAMAGATFGAIGSMAWFREGSADNGALVADLRKMLDCADLVGIRLKDGMVVLRLVIDADDLSGHALVDRFAIIHQRTIDFQKYALTILKTWFKETKSPTISQGIVVFSQHNQAKKFVADCGNKCKHSTFWRGTRTQPWVIDLQEETVVRCAGFRQLSSALPLDSEKALSGIFRVTLQPTEIPPA